MKLKDKRVVKISESYRKRINNLETISVLNDKEFYVYYSPHIGVLAKELVNKETEVILRDLTIIGFRHCFDSSGNHVLLYRNRKGLKIMYKPQDKYIISDLKDFESKLLYLETVDDSIVVLALDIENSSIFYSTSKDNFSSTSKLNTDGKESLKDKWIKYFTKRLDGSTGLNLISDSRVIKEYLDRFDNHYTKNTTYIELPLSIEEFKPLVKSKRG